MGKAVVRVAYMRSPPRDAGTEPPTQNTSDAARGGAPDDTASEAKRVIPVTSIFRPKRKYTFRTATETPRDPAPTETSAARSTIDAGTMTASTTDHATDTASDTEGRGAVVRRRRTPRRQRTRTTTSDSENERPARRKREERTTQAEDNRNQGLRIPDTVPLAFGANGAAMRTGSSASTVPLQKSGDNILYVTHTLTDAERLVDENVLRGGASCGIWGSASPCKGTSCVVYVVRTQTVESITLAVPVAIADAGTRLASQGWVPPQANGVQVQDVTAIPGPPVRSGGPPVQHLLINTQALGAAACDATASDKWSAPDPKTGARFAFVFLRITRAPLADQTADSAFCGGQNAALCGANPMQECQRDACVTGARVCVLGLGRDIAAPPAASVYDCDDHCVCLMPGHQCPWLGNLHVGRAQCATSGWNTTANWGLGGPMQLASTQLQQQRQRCAAFGGGLGTSVSVFGPQVPTLACTETVWRDWYSCMDYTQTCDPGLMPWWGRSSAWCVPAGILSCSIPCVRGNTVALHTAVSLSALQFFTAAAVERMRTCHSFSTQTSMVASDWSPWTHVVELARRSHAIRHTGSPEPTAAQAQLFHTANAVVGRLCTEDEIARKAHCSLYETQSGQQAACCRRSKALHDQRKALCGNGNDVSSKTITAAAPVSTAAPAAPPGAAATGDAEALALKRENDELRQKISTMQCQFEQRNFMAPFA